MIPGCATAPVKPNVFPSMRDTIVDLGFTANLKLLLDAGDGRSYTSGQSWLDLSGGGYDFFLGADGSATGTDPTFNGNSNGMSAAEFFSVDGGDYFTYDSAVETWMSALHKAGAFVQIEMWVYVATPATGAAQVLFATSSSAADAGIRVIISSTGNLEVLIDKAGTTTNAIGPAVSSGWHLLGVRIDDSGVNNTSILVDGANASTVSVISNGGSPSASNAPGPVRIGARADGSDRLGSGSRIAAVLIWQGGTGTHTGLYNATKSRFGL